MSGHPRPHRRPDPPDRGFPAPPEFCTQHGMPAFRWQIPERFNMGADVSDRHGASLALSAIDPSGKTRQLTFDAVSVLSTRLANVPVARGLQLGDRMAVSVR